MPLGDAEALADAIDRVLADPAAWRAAAAKAASASEPRTIPTSFARTIEGIYRELVTTRVIEGVSFVVPVHNGAAWIRETINVDFVAGRWPPMEVIVVDDHSRDGSIDTPQSCSTQPCRCGSCEARAAAPPPPSTRACARTVFTHLSGGPGRVAGAGLDAVPDEEFDDPTVAASQGYYVTARDATMCARAMSLDLEQRYAAIAGDDTDHVCSGNSAYRADALRRVALFDESLGYGYDNDISYRLRAEGSR